MYYDYYLYYLSYLSSLYNGYPLLVRVMVLIVTALIIIVLLSLFRLLYFGYKINRQDKRIKKTREYFEGRLDFVMKSDTNYDVGEIRELLQYDVSAVTQWKADLLTDVVLYVKNTVNKTGRLNTINYKNCLEALGLTGFWEKRIRASGLNKKREALLVIREIDNGVNSGVLSKSTFHKDSDLRKTARDLYTSQDSYNPFRFMEENFDESFTQLDKLRLHATLVKRSREGKLPNLLRWINNSKNTNYVVFIIRELGFFKQYEASATLVSMLDKQENKDIRARIVLTLGELDYQECMLNLIERFNLETNTVREAIIKTMGAMKNKESLDFLEDAYHSTDDDNAKIVVARAIIQHGTDGEQFLLRLKEETVAKEREQTLLDQVFAEKVMISV